jgi:MarR family transcriptional regulator, 2-MHQ and catechol-resistance regulon repressor
MLATTNMDLLEELKTDMESERAKSYFSLLATTSWIENRIREALRPFNLTHAQLNALYILVQNHPEPIPAKALKEKILVSNPDVTRLLDRLVKKGFVLRETCPENRRKIDISVTESGIELFHKAHFEAKKALRNYFEDQVSKDEANELRKILNKMRS